MNDFVLLPRPWMNPPPNTLLRKLTSGLAGDEVFVQGERTYVKGKLIAADGTTHLLGYWHQLVPVNVTHCITEQLNW